MSAATTWREQTPRPDGLVTRSKRAPRVEHVDELGYVVFGTHDVEVAVALVHAHCIREWDDGALPAPQRAWGRKMNWSHYDPGAYSWTWSYARPGDRGASPVVVFSEETLPPRAVDWQGQL